MKKIIILACLLFPSMAFAQYYSPAPSSQYPGGFHNRTGRLMFGFSAGLGGMSDKGGDIECANCAYGTLSGQLEGHIGGFLGPRFALMGEAQANLQTLETDGFSDTTLVQSALMLAGQYWLTPQLWIKGGIGFANLQVQDDYGGVSRPENGTALMGAAGFELLSARFFSVDLQGRLINGSYKGIDDNVTAFSIGLGINWY
jgi:outer membrane protein with beta-barrel domain